MSYRGRDAMPGASSVPPGTRLNGIYEVDRLIAQGGMGEVYEGHSVEIGDRVAIKVVLPEFAADQLIVELFRKEARVLHLLHHDAIVRYHMFATDERLARSYLAMEFVDGQSLAVRLRSGPMSLDEAIILKNRLADGLQLAHDAGIVHRDLSLDNVILPGGMVSRAKIIDFGIAKSATVGGERTLIGSSFAGRKTYASPEQLGMFAPAKVSGRSDIYSLALVLAAVLRGDPIDMSGSPVEEIEKRRKVPDLVGIPPEMHELLTEMLQPDPADRLASMADVRDWEVTPTNPAPQLLMQARSTIGSTPTDRASGSKRPPVINRPVTRRPTAPPPTAFADDMSGGGNRMGLWIGIGTVLTIALGAVGGWFYVKSVSPSIAPNDIVTEAPSTPGNNNAGAGDEPPANATTNTSGSTPPTGTGATATPGNIPAAGTGVTTTAGGREEPPVVPRKPPQPITNLVEAANFIREFDGGECFFISPIDLGDKVASVVGFGTKVDGFNSFVADFTLAAGFEPDVNLRLVSEAQCGVVDSLRRISQSRGKGIKPGLRMPERQTLKQGETLTGSISAPPNVSVELLTVDAAGGTYRMTDALQSGSFSIPANLPAGSSAAEAPNLLIVLASPEKLVSLAGLDPDTPAAAAQVFPELVKQAETAGKMTVNIGYFKVSP